MPFSQGRRIRPLAVLWSAAFLCCVLAAGCAGRPAPAPGVPAPGDPALLSSSQTRPGPRMIEAASALAGKSETGRAEAAMKWVAENLAYAPWENSLQFTRNAETLFADQTLGGCSDYALAELALFRLLGLPSRLVLTVNAKWIERVKTLPQATPNGHAFIEVFADGAWRLADPTYFRLYEDYDPALAFLPGNEIRIKRAADFADAGIGGVAAANAMLEEAARHFTGVYAAPSYVSVRRIPLDLPRAFVKLGDIFAGTGREDLASRMYAKAIELGPDYAPAYLARGLWREGRGQADKAAADLTRYLDLVRRTGIHDQDAQTQASLTRARDALDRIGRERRGAAPGTPAR